VCVCIDLPIDIALFFYPVKLALYAIGHSTTPSSPFTYVESFRGATDRENHPSCHAPVPLVYYPLMPTVKDEPLVSPRVGPSGLLVSIYDAPDQTLFR
jgi:hypothetical protein